MITEQLANEIGGALQRLAELGTNTIVSAESAAERRGLDSFLARVLPENATELMACWFTMQRQYKPLIQGFAGLLAHATAAVDRSQPTTTEAKQ